MGRVLSVRNLLVVCGFIAIVALLPCHGRGIARAEELGEVDVAAAIDELSSRRFESRQAAYMSLVRSGGAVIEALEGATRTSDSEVAARCVAALTEIARDKEDLAAALSALERLAADPSVRVAKLARDAAEELNLTDEERALRALVAAGCQILHDGKGEIYGVTVRRDRETGWLRYLSTLRYVRLEGPRITDSCVESLVRLKQPLNLYMSQTGITDAGLRGFRKFEQLNSLTLNSKLVTGSGIRQLGDVSTLKTLSFTEPVNKSCAEALSRLSQIRSLSLHGANSVTPILANSINQLEGLQVLIFQVTDLDDDQCGQLAQILTPFHLYVSASNDVSPAGWERLADARIRFLSLSGASVDDIALSHIGSIDKLANLFIRDAPITDQGLRHLERLTSLRYLRLTNTEVTKEGIKRLRQALPGLRNVNVTAVPRRAGPRVAARGPAFRLSKNPFSGRTDVRMSLGLTREIAAELPKIRNKTVWLPAIWAGSQAGIDGRCSSSRRLIIL